MSVKKRATADECCQKIRWEDLDMGPIRGLIAAARNEDLEGTGLKRKPEFPGDHSANLVSETKIANVVLRAREPMVLCGLELAKEALAIYDPEIELHASESDGDQIEKETAIATIEGRIRSILQIERSLLNFMQKLSGVATTTNDYVNVLGDSSTRLLDTRKTTPGYRYLEKYAVACGGGWNHRMGLFDRVMLKDNHLASFGGDLETSAIQAVETSRSRHPDMLIEIEVDCIEQIDIALKAEADIVLLDNFSIDQLKEARELTKDRIITEISGEVTLENLGEMSRLGHDFISTGATIHHSNWIDIGLDWE